MSQTSVPKPDLRELLFAAVEHLDHVLPGQAPILNFVHHNTLHGFQHLPFFQALEAVRKLTGIHGYLPEAQFRQIYQSGRINDDDLAVAFSAIYENQQDHKITAADRSIDRLEVYRIALIHGIEAIEPGPFNWQVEELDALNRFQQDIPAAIRDQYLQNNPAESPLVQSLWAASLAVFGLDYDLIHPEELIGLPMLEAETILAELNPGESNPAVCAINPGIHPQTRAEALAQLNSLFASVGKGLSLVALLKNLTGVNLLDQIQPVLIRFCASLMDEGISAWQAPQREQGLYAAWKNAMVKDATFSLLEMPNWRAKFAALPEQSVDAVAQSLRELQIPENRWKDYLERIALEIPGWSGMMNWRSHAHYPANQQAPVSIMDYLAIRLFLDQLWLEQLSRKTWGIAGNYGSLKAYFERNSSELLARKLLYAGELPEYLSNNAQKLVALNAPGHHKVEDWRNLADLIWAYQHSKAAVQTQGHDVYASVWRLFRLAQHLGLTPNQVQGLTMTEAETLLAWLDKFGASERGQIWLLAYEQHYRAELFNALAQNHGRGRWKQRETRASAQAIFCMDDREESIRRHLEEIDPTVETLGAAGFFGVAMNWLGLDDQTPTALCPVVVTPTHEIREISRPGAEQALAQHQTSRTWALRLKKILHQETRRNLLTSAPLVGVFSPLALVTLIGKTLFPLRFSQIVQRIEKNFATAVPTTLQLTAIESGDKSAPPSIKLGFTDREQADRVGGFLRNIGLTSGFAPLVVVVGHGSHSQNNPHLAAYDCGACSGRHGGPNARTFAAMANRSEVRAILAERGIHIPSETWFLGSEHNTCNEDFQWFDLDLIPERFKPAWHKLQTNLNSALHLSAHERCRRFASAPRRPTLAKAMAHIVGRSADFSQTRPELGHATNAAAVIGRRSVTRGAFFDRRVFLISYDPSLDQEGSILEGILLAAGPVGAGINLEYYFSTVDNERFGCGSKVPHNVTGLFGVMEGTTSDLRTGLPRQMIEIHEAIRLSVVCEATEEVLTGIYRRQQPLRELIGNGWILLSAIHPETGAISCFDPQKGFVPWQNDSAPLPQVYRSAEWYEGHSEPLSPALTCLPDQQEVRHAA